MTYSYYDDPLIPGMVPYRVWGGDSGRGEPNLPVVTELARNLDVAAVVMGWVIGGDGSDMGVDVDLRLYVIDVSSGRVYQSGGSGGDTETLLASAVDEFLAGAESDPGERLQLAR